MIRRHLMILLASLVVFSACSEDNPEYRAEKQLFEATKLNKELSAQLTRPSGEFLDRTLNAYADLVQEFTPIMYEHPGLERLVLKAQIARAELENRAGRFSDAHDHFVEVLDLERSEPGARMNAIYSAGVMCELMRDPQCAIEHFEMFFDHYLSLDKVAETANEAYRYLVTPLKIADLARATGGEASDALWLMQAETLYRGMLAKYTDEELQLHARLHLLTALIQQGKWQEAEAMTQDIADEYELEHVQASTTFLRARIRQEGFKDDQGALETYMSVYEQYPNAIEAPNAMIATAAILLRTGRTEDAQRVYEVVVERYSEDAGSAAEALWQLADLARDRGDLAEAANYYRSILSTYPRTSYAFEAPLQLAQGYQDIGEPQNAATWYRNASQKYTDIVNDRGESEVMKIMAEEYMLQVYTLQEKWDRAIEHLLEMPPRYPDFVSLHGNYLTAAEIYEKELGDVPEAIEVLQEFQGRYPDSPIAPDVDTQLERLRGMQ